MTGISFRPEQPVGKPVRPGIRSVQNGPDHQQRQHDEQQGEDHRHQHVDHRLRTKSMGSSGARSLRNIAMTDPVWKFPLPHFSVA